MSYFEPVWIVIRNLESGDLALGHIGNVPAGGWEAAGWSEVEGPFSLAEAQAVYRRLEAAAASPEAGQS